MLTAATVVLRRGRTFLGVAAARVVGERAGGCDRLPRPYGSYAVMMACERLRGRRGRGGARSSAREYSTCS
jgi:hypothetical protein